MRPAAVTALVLTAISTTVAGIAGAAPPQRTWSEQKLGERAVQTAPLLDFTAAHAAGDGEFSLSLEGALTRAAREGEKPHDPKPLRIQVARYRGVWSPAVLVDASQLNRGSSSAKLTPIPAEGPAFRLDANIGSDQWVAGDPAASYTVRLTLDDNRISGTYEGTFQGRKLQGSVTGSFLRTGWANVPFTDGVARAEFDLGEHLQNWNVARWAVIYLPAVTDISEADGLLVTVRTPRPRHDVFLDAAAMESDGSWYSVRDAVPLSAREVTVLVDWDHARHAEFVFNAAGTATGAEGNFDEDFALDRTRISRLALGVVNGNGVGKVQFDIAEIRLARWKQRPANPTPVQVSVTGRLLSINGQQTVPPGVFGFHMAGGDARELAELQVGSVRHHRAMAMGGGFVEAPLPEHGIPLVVSTQYDRRQQMPQIDKAAYNPRWTDQMASAGTAVGRQAAPHGANVAAEFWNEAYLDLGTYLERDLARLPVPEGVKPGDPVRLGDFTLPSMAWADPSALRHKHRFWHDAPPAASPAARPAGDEPAQLKPADPTRFTYWSGRSIAELYIAAYNVWAKAARELAPDLQLVASMGFRWQEDDWASWHILHKPIIDACIEFIDGIGEHHYQGFTDAMPATYEVLQAYTQTRFARRPGVYNTECNDLWDAPARGLAAAEGQFAGKFKSRRRMIYNFRGILTAIHQTPDKIAARAIHACWAGARDPRSRLQQPVRLGDLTITATAAELADDGVLTVTLQLENKSRKDATFSPAGATLHPGIDRSAKAIAHVADADGAADAAAPADVAVPRNQSRTATLRFAVPAEHRKAGLLLSIAPSGPLVHVAGPFQPIERPPWVRMGIDKGEYYALKALVPLRGNIVEAQSAHPELWAVASLNPGAKALVVVLFNDAPGAREVALSIDAPPGTSFAKPPEKHLLAHDGEGNIGITSTTLDAASVAGPKAMLKLSLLPSHAATIVLPLAGSLPEKPHLIRTQTFAGDPKDPQGGILRDLAPGQTTALPIRLDAAELQQARRAWLRLVLENCREEDASVTIGTLTIPLPAAHTPPNAPYIREVAIDPAALTGVTELLFTARNTPTSNGFRLCMASIVLETPAR